MAQDYRALLGTDTFSNSRGYINSSLLALLTCHAGATAPSNPTAYMYWLDTTNGYVKRRNAANDAWVVEAILGAEYGGMLPLAGGTMSGSINMGGQVISNVGQGSGSAAARMTEVDLKAPIAAPLFTGDARVNQDPAGSDSIPRRSWTETRYLKLAGGTMTGPIVLAADAAADLQAVPRRQLRDVAGFSLTVGHRHDGADARKVRAVSLYSDSTPLGMFVRSAGGGLVDWSTMRPEYFQGDANEQLVLNTSSQTDWTTLDLSAFISAPEAHAAVLKVMLDFSMATPPTVSFRKTGSGLSTGQTWTPFTSQRGQFVTIVDCTGRQIDYKVSANIGGSLKVYLLSYFRWI